MPMPQPHLLRRFEPSDLEELLRVYGQAVVSQCAALYSPQQVEAWARHPWLSEGVAATIQRGYTLVNPQTPAEPRLVAFGVLDPIERLALLYCDGRSSRQGRSSALLAALEAHARSQGVEQLRTEASQLSKPLLLRRGWQIDAAETVLFAGVHFERWRMIKPLTPGHG